MEECKITSFHVFYLHKKYHSTIHTLIVYSVLKIPKSEYRIQHTASNPHLTRKIHTLIVYSKIKNLKKQWQNKQDQHISR